MQPNIRIGVLGSGAYRPLTDAAALVERLPRQATIVTRGTCGIEYAVGYAARRRRITAREYRPFVEYYGADAPRQAAFKVARECDRLVVFLADGRSPLDEPIRAACDLALSLGKEVVEVRPGGQQTTVTSPRIQEVLHV